MNSPKILIIQNKIMTDHLLASTRYFNESNFQNGLREINLSIEQNPHDSYLFSNKAVFQAELGNTSQALKDLKTSIALNYLNYVSYFNLFSIHIRQNNLQHAVQDLHCALSALYLVAAKQFKNYQYASKSVHYAKNNTAARVLKGLMQMEQGKFKQAHDELVWACGIQTQNNVLSKVRDLIKKIGDSEQVLNQEDQIPKKGKQIKKLQSSFNFHQCQDLEKQIHQRLVQFDQVYRFLSVQQGILTQKVGRQNIRNKNLFIRERRTLKEQQIDKEILNNQRLPIIILDNQTLESGNISSQHPQQVQIQQTHENVLQTAQIPSINIQNHQQKVAVVESVYTVQTVNKLTLVGQTEVILQSAQIIPEHQTRVESVEPQHQVQHIQLQQVVAVSTKNEEQPDIVQALQPGLITIEQPKQVVPIIVQQNIQQVQVPLIVQNVAQAHQNDQHAQQIQNQNEQVVAIERREEQTVAVLESAPIHEQVVHEQVSVQAKQFAVNTKQAYIVIQQNDHQSSQHQDTIVQNLQQQNVPVLESTNVIVQNVNTIVQQQTLQTVPVFESVQANDGITIDGVTATSTEEIPATEQTITQQPQNIIQTQEAITQQVAVQNPVVEEKPTGDLPLLNVEQGVWRTSQQEVLEEKPSIDGKPLQKPVTQQITVEQTTPVVENVVTEQTPIVEQPVITQLQSSVPQQNIQVLESIPPAVTYQQNFQIQTKVQQRVHQTIQLQQVHIVSHSQQEIINALQSAPITTQITPYQTKLQVLESNQQQIQTLPQTIVVQNNVLIGEQTKYEGKHQQQITILQQQAVVQQGQNNHEVIASQQQVQTVSVHLQSAPPAQEQVLIVQAPVQDQRHQEVTVVHQEEQIANEAPLVLQSGRQQQQIVPKKQITSFQTVQQSHPIQTPQQHEPTLIEQIQDKIHQGIQYLAQSLESENQENVQISQQKKHVEAVQPISYLHSQALEHTENVIQMREQHQVQIQQLESAPVSTERQNVQETAQYVYVQNMQFQQTQVVTLQLGNIPQTFQQQQQQPTIIIDEVKSSQSVQQINQTIAQAVESVLDQQKISQDIKEMVEQQVHQQPVVLESAPNHEQHAQNVFQLQQIQKQHIEQQTKQQPLESLNPISVPQVQSIFPLIALQLKSEKIEQQQKQYQELIGKLDSKVNQVQSILNQIQTAIHPEDETLNAVNNQVPEQ